VLHLDRSDIVQRLLDETSWQDGRPRERDLVALFAAMEPEELDQLLRQMLIRATAEFESERRRLDAIRTALSQPHPQAGLTDPDWDFPGGDQLLDAVEAMETSSRLWPSALKSLAHATEAVALAVGAIVEHRGLVQGLPTDRREAWRIVLGVIAKK
jgi:hypothetical protein